MIVVTQMFTWAFMRLVRKSHSLPCKKHLHGEKSQAKDVLIGKWLHNTSISHQKLKTLMKTMFARKVILFLKSLEYQFML